MNTLCKKLLTYILLSSTPALFTMEPVKCLPEIAPLNTDELAAQWDAEQFGLSVNELKELFMNNPTTPEPLINPSTQPQTSNTYVDKQIQCPRCKKSFDDPLSCSFHSASCTTPFLYICSYEGCSKKYIKEMAFEKHKRMHQNQAHLLPNILEDTNNSAQLPDIIQKKQAIKEEKYFCIYCNKSCSSSSSLSTHNKSKKHIERVRALTPHATLQLPDFFQKKLEIKHRKQALEKRKYFCIYCNISCSSSNSLSIHNQTKKHIETIRALTPYDNLLK